MQFVHSPAGPVGAPMNAPAFLHVPPEKMTVRARLYLAIGAARHLSVAAIAFVAANYYDGSPWAVLISVLSLKVWALAFFIGGLHFAYSATVGDEAQARVALVVSAALTASWAAGFFLSAVEGSATAVFIGVLLAALAGKDLVVCAQPLRSPFEPIVRKIARPDRDG